MASTRCPSLFLVPYPATSYEAPRLFLAPPSMHRKCPFVPQMKRILRCFWVFFGEILLFKAIKKNFFFFLNSPHFWNFHEALSSRKLFLLVSWLCFYSPISKVELCKLFLSYILASQPEAVTALKILWHRGLSLCALTSPVTLVHSPSENTECSLLPPSDRPLTHTHASTWTSTQ